MSRADVNAALDQLDACEAQLAATQAQVAQLQAVQVSAQAAMDAATAAKTQADSDAAAGQAAIVQVTTQLQSCKDAVSAAIAGTYP